MKPLRIAALYLVSGALLALLFMGFPALDIETARLFYRPGEGFFLKDNLLVVVSYELVELLETLMYVLVAVLVLAHLVPWLRRLRLRPAAIVCIALSFLLGPALVTNELLKNQMGRARPSQVVEFGGTKAYTPPAVPADQCERNCAFVTGHGAFAFGFAVFAFLLPPGARRRQALAGAIAFGGLVGLGRMIQGGHWLSDVIFAGLVNIAIAWAICEWLDRRDGLARLTARLRRQA